MHFLRVCITLNKTTLQPSGTFAGLKPQPPTRARRLSKAHDYVVQHPQPSVRSISAQGRSTNHFRPFLGGIGGWTHSSVEGIALDLRHRARVDGKLERILNWKIAQKSLGQPRVYATTCDESGIIWEWFLVIVYDLSMCSDFRAICRANVTKILVYMSP